jgi:hypothetical protein
MNEDTVIQGERIGILYRCRVQRTSEEMPECKIPENFLHELTDNEKLLSLG